MAVSRTEDQTTVTVISCPSAIAVCGVGQIGLSLGLCCWRSGYEALLYDRDGDTLAEALPKIKAMDSWLTSEFPQSSPSYGTLQTTSDLAVVDYRADLVLESISEDLTAKVALFRSLCRAAQRGAVFCSCTSGLSISEMGVRSGRPSQLVGTHFWSPPHLMPLVEVVRGAASSEEALQTAMEFCRRLGKQTVLVNVDAPGFIGNRLLHAMWREAINIVERGIASAEEVDKVARLTIGMRQATLGPLEHMDLAGLDLIHAIHQYLLTDLASQPSPAKLLEQMVDKGRLGVKSGHGFYNWESRSAEELARSRDRQILRELQFLSCAD